MKKRYSYSYSVLRYVHDVATAEFVNIGVAVHCKDLGFFEVTCRSTVGRMADFFPDLNGKNFRAMTKLISRRFKDLTEVCNEALDLQTMPDDLDKLLATVLPKDDSALTWSESQGGLTLDPKKTLSDLLARYVTKYDSRNLIHKRTDEDVWRHFSRELENRHLSNFFVEKTIAAEDDVVQFKSAWKNGIWHCVEPISFDLSAPDSIRDKAHRFLGQMTSVADATERFKLYLVLASPSEPALLPAFNQAVQILRKVQTEKEIFTEDETTELVELFREQIAEHLKNTLGNDNSYALGA